MHKNMDIPPYEEFLKQLKPILWLSGYPYGSVKIEKRFYILVCALAAMTASEAGYFFSNISAENFLQLTRSAPCVINAMLSFTKAVQVGLKQAKIFELSENLHQLYDRILLDPKKKQLVGRDLVLINMMLKPYIWLNVVLICIYNFSTLGLMLNHYITTNEIKLMLPYSALIPFETNTWVPWLLYYAYSATCGFVAVIFYTAIDGFYVMLSTHVCANFCIISDIIAGLDETNVDALKDVLKAHQYILKLGDDLEDIFRAPNLFNMLAGAILICALGLNIMIGPWEHLLGSLLFLISVIVQILMMSVFGENIIRDSTKVGDAAYHCKWYNMDAKYRKVILLIMIRANKPQQLTAYKFSVICYASFSKIISSSWSYFTILKTVFNPPDQKLMN